MLQNEVLILKLVAVDGLAASAVTGGEIASLAHEVWDHAVEARALVAEALLPCAQSTEVLGRLGDHVGAKLQQDNMLNECTTGLHIRGPTVNLYLIHCIKKTIYIYIIYILY